MPSQAPAIVDQENKWLERRLFAFLYSLQVHEAARFFQGQLITGARSGAGAADVRQHSALPACYPHSRAHQAVIVPGLLTRAYAMSEKLLDLFGQTEEQPFLIGSRAQQHSRLRRGFNALLAALREQYGNQRLHHFERALEAVTHPPIKRTKRKFVSRCTVFAGCTLETRQVLKEIYDLRCAEEHLNEWQPCLAAHSDAEDVAALRSYQAEVLACFVYRRILGDAGLRAEFATDATTATFWNRTDPSPARTWGAQCDIREDALRDSARLLLL